MVRAGAICIDTTEVTETQYQAFMTAKAGDVSGQVPQCTWNTDWSPKVSTCLFDPTGHATFPVTGMDWCDAWGFCAWAGKRLCGRVDGGVVPSTDGGVIDDPKQSERTAVCTKDGLHRFPYGDTFDKNACNGGEHDGTRDTVPVGSTPGCVGGYPGVFDMAGNVHEWENACDKTPAGGPGANDICAFRGGSYHDVLADSCFTDFAWERARIDCDIGFRCCADP
jgi:formylglycine-generating enzyme required for sulfatase activity